MKDYVKEGILPLGGILGITAVLVGIFALCLYLGSGMEPVIPIHMDDGETVDPNPMRLVFMLVGFVLSFVLAFVADRKGKRRRFSRLSSGATPVARFCGSLWVNAPGISASRARII